MRTCFLPPIPYLSKARVDGGSGDGLYSLHLTGCGYVVALDRNVHNGDGDQCNGEVLGGHADDDEDGQEGDHRPCSACMQRTASGHFTSAVLKYFFPLQSTVLNARN
jgi:hypothetical protein